MVLTANMISAQGNVFRNFDFSKSFIISSTDERVSLPILSMKTKAEKLNYMCLTDLFSA